MKKTLILIIVLIAVFFASCEHTPAAYYAVVVVSDGTVRSTEAVPENTSFILPAPEARSGYKFRGWKVNDSSDLLGKGKEITITSNTVITADWVQVFSVTFDLDGGVSEEIHDLTPEINGTVEKPASDPTKTGYTFLGWDRADKTSYEGTGYDFSSPVTSDVALKAFWKINTYSVSFSLEGGETSSSSSVETQNIDYNNKATKPGTDPTYYGYTFEGWTADGTTAYDFDTPVTRDISLKAMWKEVLFTVTFLMDGGEAVDPVTVQQGKTLNQPDVKKTCYEFDKWIDIGTGSEFVLSTPVTGNMTLKAVWKYADCAIGSTGPAGGYIFYDCDADNTEDGAGPDNLSSAKDGWRYLESGRACIGYYKWGLKAAEFSVSYDIGKGKSNTENIIKTKESDSTLSFPAAEACWKQDVYGNGYTDWFLPSLNELIAMYKTLPEEKKKEKGFSQSWSSSMYSKEYAEVRIEDRSQSSSITNSSWVLPARSF